MKDFALIAAPLQKLLHKDVSFQWSEEAQVSFEQLRHSLFEAPILAVPDFSPDSGTFILETDASLESAGACLKQRVGDDEKVIAYGSHRFSKAQTNYSTTKRELLAVVIFVEKFAPYLLGRHFVVRTDHSSLRWIMNFRNPTGILARWLEILARFQFSIEHRPGAEHVLADALSRLPADGVADKACQTEPEMVQCSRVTSDDWSTSYLRSEQDKDADVSEITKFLSAGVKPKSKDLPKSCHPYLSHWSKLRLVDGVLFHVYKNKPFDSDQLQFVLPKSLTTGALASLHSGPTGGHFAADKLFEQTRLRFWWPRMFSEIEDFCKRCPQCGSRNAPIPTPRASLGEISASEPLEMVGLDILSSLPETASGHKHILTGG